MRRTWVAFVRIFVKVWFYEMRSIYLYLYANLMTRYVRKRTFGHVRQRKIQVILCVRADWSESSLLDSHECKVSPCGQRRLWSDCAFAQSDRSLRWAHMSKGIFLPLRFSCPLLSKVFHLCSISVALTEIFRIYHSDIFLICFCCTTDLCLWVVSMLKEHIIWDTPFENVSSGICGQRRSRSACASAQSDRDLCRPLIESLGTVEHV